LAGTKSRPIDAGLNKIARRFAELKSIVGFAFVDKNQAQTAGARHNKPYL